METVNPLVKKLGIKEEMKVRFIDAPIDFFDLLSLPNIKLLDHTEQLADYIHVFAYEKNYLIDLLPKLRYEIEVNGMIWVSWQKKSSGIKTDVDGNVIRALAKPLGLVDAKVCSIDNTWSALKLVIRKELR